MIPLDRRFRAVVGGSAGVVFDASGGQGMSSRPRIGLVGSGGTITAWSPSNLDLVGYTEAGSRRLQLDELLAAVPEVEAVAEVLPVAGPAGPSHATTLPALLEIADAVRSVRDDSGVVGVVVTHGTNTLEELAFLLSLVLDAGKPVVLTAAMRPLSALSGDGPLNLVDAFRVASHQEAAGRGPLVTMNGKIWTAREVSKFNTAGTDAFDGGEYGPLGRVDADGAVLFRHREARPVLTMPITAGHRVPRVDVVVSYPGADAVPIDAAVAAGAAGIVSAGTGAGFPTPDEQAALLRAVRSGVMVCQSYRGVAGRVYPRPQLARDGIVAGQSLSWPKCRVLLALALSTGAGADDVQRLFNEVGGA